MSGDKKERRIIGVSTNGLGELLQGAIEAVRAGRVEVDTPLFRDVKRYELAPRLEIRRSPKEALEALAGAEYLVIDNGKGISGAQLAERAVAGGYPPERIYVVTTQEALGPDHVIGVGGNGTLMTREALMDAAYSPHHRRGQTDKKPA